MRAAILALLAIGCAIVAGRAPAEARPCAQEPAPSPDSAPVRAGCLACHAGIEEMHPEAKLSCVDCHGGKESATRKEDAHVRAPNGAGVDERVAPLDADLAWRRFQNPMDLRVARSTCGECHEKGLAHLLSSLHGTTAGHLSDGYYEVGLLPEKGSRFAVFPTRDPRGGPGFSALPAFDERARKDRLATHYPDLARKECLQCHLWSAGRAVEGRVGFDGDYRGEGCAACHVTYAPDGLSQSADAAAPRNEPGHPSRHVLTRAAPTSTCTTCHWGDASIGLDFRGLAQLPPGAPGGPEIPGTTGQMLNRQYYLQDAATNPPDVHHERGMHCIDCHTVNDVMGDGVLHGSMEDAVEISCSDCHGTFTARATLVSERGTPLANLRREGDRVLLTSKVDGRQHEVVQVVDVITPGTKVYNAAAARAMTAKHAAVECYACHASWNPNFLGFHFDRNESLTQLDLLTGKRTPGRVTTQEKVFATWKGFYAGRNERGRIAPYLTGFSTMGSFTDAQGERVLDQVLPVTAAGLSGLTMIHHQPHTVRDTARACVECHRTSTTWGLGSGNFQLARQLAFVADRRGIEIVALDRSRLAGSVPLTKLVQPDVVALAIRSEPLQGQAQSVFAAEAGRGVHRIDVRDPTAPRRAGFLATVDPRALVERGGYLYVADGVGGLAVLDGESEPGPRLLGRLATCDARDIRVQWPWAYVADGAGGLWLADVREPSAPRSVGALQLTRRDGAPGAVVAVDVLFQTSRPRSRKEKDGREVPTNARTIARTLVAVVDERRGLLLVDATEPARPRTLWPDPDKARRTDEQDRAYRDVVLQTHVDLAQPQGGTRTVERDYAYVLSEEQPDGQRASHIEIVDVTDPLRPRRVEKISVGEQVEEIALASVYNPPFLQTILCAPGDQGLAFVDAAVSAQPTTAGGILGSIQARAIAVESFPLDRMLDERDRPLKDVSHEVSRWLKRPEIARLLDVSARELAIPEDAHPPPAHPAFVLAREYAAMDLDKNGFLEGREIADALRGRDLDADGRVTLSELASLRSSAEADPVRTRADPNAASDEGRPGRDSEAARLFDGIDPHAFDRDGDGRLRRPELDTALFASLDLDRDQRLTPSELSRLPGSARAIRYGGPAAAAEFASVDRNGDGQVAPAELRTPDELWSGLDADRDGAVQLDVPRGSKLSRQGRATTAVEWPYRQHFRTSIPPGRTREVLLAAWDQDRDGRIQKRELAKRPDVFLELDDDADGVVSAAELQLRLDVLRDAGLGACVESFLARWDLDGDGAVQPKEIGLPVWLRERVLGPR
ncbi:MAG: hypothetical protein NTY35_11570 [Planctomycetota bacterium]|nr:hypothetical protein [Planctomycetota bacterium]